MRELHDAREVVTVMYGGVAYVLWAPGDATVYRVALLDVVGFDAITALDAAHDLLALVVLVGRSGAGSALVIPRPNGEERPWNAARFHTTYGREFAGWWAGIRPLLAALRWTTDDCSSVEYDPSDAAAIGALVRSDA